MKYTDNIVFGLDNNISNNIINVINEYIKSNNLIFDIQSSNFRSLDIINLWLY